MSIGRVTLEDGQAVTVTVSRVNARAHAVAYDRTTFRAPYGTRMHTSGDATRDAERVTLSFDVSNAEGITAAAENVIDLLSTLNAAVLVTTPVGVYMNAGLLRHHRAPTEAGYHVDVTFLARGDRMEDDTGVLRFISGRVWETR